MCPPNQTIDKANSPEQAFSYIRRRGRFTHAQSRAYANLLEQYRISPQDLGQCAGPVGMEIGFGMGAELLGWARQNPSWYLCGVELYQPGIGAILTRLHSQQLVNVGIVDQPAQQVLAALPEQSLSEVRIFFPDPWPKKRHFKRRLIQTEFLRQLRHVMKMQALVRLATDWAPYGDWMVEQFSEVSGYKLVEDRVRGRDAGSATAVRGTTKFEARGERLGHNIRDLVYEKTAN